MSKPYYEPQDKVILPPKNAEVFSTCCDYCIVACGYKVYRWPVNAKPGGPGKKQNALKRDFILSGLTSAPGRSGNWLSPNQLTQATYNGKLYNIAVVPDGDSKVVNVGGDASIRGGCIAQKVYNPKKPTRDRLKHPMVRIHDALMPVSWDFALDIMAEVSKHVLKHHGENAWGLKYFSYQYYENTYALTKLAFRNIGTPAVAHHDHPSIVNSVPGWVDIGYDIFPASYEDFSLADTILLSGTDPYETKTIVWNEWILKGIRKNGTKVIMVNPRRTAGVAYAEKHGGLWIDITPGTDQALHNAIARVILEKGWEDKAFIDRFVNNKWETDSGFGQGTRNTPWQWRTTWGKIGVVDGIEDYKKWIFSEESARPEVAAEICGIDVKKIYRAAELMAKPSGEKRPKVTIGIEKGNYWSNNWGNTASVGVLGILCGAGGRPGSAVTRLGGHQRGGRSGGPYPGIRSPYKFPGRRRHRLDLDRWVEAGHLRFAYVVGTTWIQAMAGSSAMQDSFKRQVRLNPHQVKSSHKEDIIETLKKRVDSGGMVVVNQDIYLIDPIGREFADIILPAATWGEDNFTRENGERRLRLYQKFYDAPGEAKPDWKIVSLFARKMGFDGYDWKDSNDVFEEACRFSRGHRSDFNAIKVAARKEGVKAHDFLGRRGTQGYQAPLLWFDGKIMETPRQHWYDRNKNPEFAIPETGPEGPTVIKKNIMAFKSQTGKLNLMKTPWNFYWNQYYDYLKPRDGELWVTGGRINEVWQSGFDDTERRTYIQQRWPMNFIEIHPHDAKSRGIESGDMVTISSDRVAIQKDFNVGVKPDDMFFNGLKKRGHLKFVHGEFSAVAIVTPAIKKGVTFTNFLHKKQSYNAISPRVPDPMTMNYNYKIAMGKIKKTGESPFKKTFSQMSFIPRDIT